MIPVTIAPIIEHIGDVYAINEVTGKDFVKDPGLHRTMLGDGLACVAAGLIGGPPVTTYSEVTGAISLTKITDPTVIRIAAVTGIVFSVFGKISAFLKSIPPGRVGRNNVVAVRYDCGCRYKQPDTKPDESGRYTQPDYCFADPYLRHRWRSN